MTSLNCFHIADHANSIPIISLTNAQYASWLAEQSNFVQTWLAQINFTCEGNQFVTIPALDGQLAIVLLSLQHEKDFWAFGKLPLNLPEKIFHIANFSQPNMAALAWSLGAYQFEKFKSPNRNPAKLIIPQAILDQLQSMPESIYLVRDLVNTPAEQMSPEDLAIAAESLAKEYGAQFSQIVGDDLLKQNYPAIHAVGRASNRAPRLIEIRAGLPTDKAITIVGKGVCFDSGGLDIKPANGMALMKKDMGGAAHALALARLILANRLPIYLRVLIPAVDNAISANAYRPGDVVFTHKGLTIEIGNTDAEGRVILADALAAAVEENPALIIDFATLTGAGRVALGAEIPAMFSNDANIRNMIWHVSETSQDLVWPMPLHQPYKDFLKSAIADINNDCASPYGGAIAAALFLQTFVGEIPWVHFDLNAWNITERAGRPVGGEAMGLRAVFEFLREFVG